jgi:hypothetical protein
MNGGSNLKFPGPSPQEEQLQVEQPALLRQQPRRPHPHAQSAPPVA